MSNASFFPWPALALLYSAGAAQSPPDGLCHGDIAIGGSSAPGNTKSTALNLRVDAGKATAAARISLNALANYSTSEGQGISTRSANWPAWPGATTTISQPDS